MKQILNRPLLFGILLSVPLWALLDNFVVALMAALLIAFLLSMIHSLRRMRDADTRRGTAKDARDSE